MLLLIIRFSTSVIFCSYQSFLIFSILVIFLHCPSIRFLEAVLVTLQLNPVCQGIVLPQSLNMLSVA
jgi:hypothetical protein